MIRCTKLFHYILHPDHHDALEPDSQHIQKTRPEEGTSTICVTFHDHYNNTFGGLVNQVNSCYRKDDQTIRSRT